MERECNAIENAEIERRNTPIAITAATAVLIFIQSKCKQGNTIEANYTLFSHDQVIKSISQ